MSVPSCLEVSWYFIPTGTKLLQHQQSDRRPIRLPTLQGPLPTLTPKPHVADNSLDRDVPFSLGSFLVL